MSLGEVASPIQVWDLLFSEDTVHKLNICTNRKLSQIRQKNINFDHLILKDVDFVEMRAFLGFLMHTEL